MSQNAFTSFARETQYQPPPDSRPLVASTSAKPSWFASSPQGNGLGAETSYQAGGIPSWSDSYGGGGGEEGPEGAVNEWETRFGWRVDIEAAVAYLLGPISALLVLVLETKNDYIRFHGYQSALYSTPGVVGLLLMRFIFPRWLWIMLLLGFIGSVFALAFRAFQDANSSSIGHGGLIRYHLPYIGPLADRWVGEE
ncbi:hypothetical protein DL93DRAFT_2130780 [Clavulina sp. PMI_390]|nr:hypothetical protein DL93DRAFT_2130780 [Clavulina sp. PMI_390]